LSERGVHEGQIPGTKIEPQKPLLDTLLTDTIFAGHHQPLKVWILCLYCMGLHVSNEHMAHELALNGSDMPQMTAQLREGIEKKAHGDAVK
jgi:hypothetical protein